MGRNQVFLQSCRATSKFWQVLDHIGRDYTDALLSFALHQGQITDALFFTFCWDCWKCIFFLLHTLLFDVNKPIWMFSLEDGLVKFKEARDGNDIGHSGNGGMETSWRTMSWEWESSHRCARSDLPLVKRRLWMQTYLYEHTRYYS